jgi:hypothetical protein
MEDMGDWQHYLQHQTLTVSTATIARLYIERFYSHEACFVHSVDFLTYKFVWEAVLLFNRYLPYAINW